MSVGQPERATQDRVIALFRDELGYRYLGNWTDLARKPIECLEYIVVHEMVHFLEATHNARFLALMDEMMPQWRHYRQRLNQLPVRHEDWLY